MESACVSTSSVSKTLVMPSSWSSALPLRRGRASTGCLPATIVSRRHRSLTRSRRVPRGHVREDHLVSLGEALTTSMVFTELRPSCTRDPLRASSLPGTSRKSSTVALRLRARGPAHGEHVVQPLQLHRALDGEVGARALGQLARERHLHQHRALAGRRGDARHRARDDAVARVHLAPSGRAATSRACVSGMRSSAFSRSGCTTLASSVPGVTHCPSSSGSSWSMPASPAFTFIDSTWLRAEARHRLAAARSAPLRRASCSRVLVWSTARRWLLQAQPLLVSSPGLAP